MSNIKVEVNYTIHDGDEMKFRAPADCADVTGLVVYSPLLDSPDYIAPTVFAFADAHGNDVGNIDHLFAEGAVVKVILDVVNGKAFVQNADTNAYLESRFDGLSNTVNELSGKLLDSYEISVLNKDSVFFYGHIDDNGIFTEYGDPSYPSVSDYVKLQKGIVYQCDYLDTRGYLDFDGGWVEETVTSPMGIYLYNSDKSFSRKLSLPSDQTNIVLQGDETYLRLMYFSPEVPDILRVYDKAKGPTKTTLNPDLEIPQLEGIGGGGSGPAPVFIGTENTLLIEYFEAYYSGKVCFMKRDLGSHGSVTWTVYSAKADRIYFYNINQSGKIQYAVLDSGGNFTVTTVEAVDKAYVDEAIGDIDEALDAIIAMQEKILGGNDA